MSESTGAQKDSSASPSGPDAASVETRPVRSRQEPDEGASGSEVGASDTATRSGAKRRRGSRGGRKRPRSEGERGPEGTRREPIASDTGSEEYDRRPNDLPDLPFEGVASGAAAERATVRRVRDWPEEPVGTAPSTERATSPSEARSGSRPSDNRRRSRTDVVARPRTGSASATGGQPETGAGVSESAVPSEGDEPRRGRGKGTPGTGRGQRNPARGEAESVARRKGLERNGRPLGRYLMCVHTRPEGTQIAVLEGRSLTEHYVSRPSDNVSEIHGNIYVGRVQNVLPGMEAAFVDIGTPKNAVLYRGDLNFEPTEVEGSVKQADLRIEQILKNSQLVLCQVTKNPIGSKGARLTQEVSLPGRFVVLVPNSDTYGISKRLADDERKRLRRILDTVKPEGHGLIVRTAAEGATPDELERDVQMLLRQWQDIDAKYRRAKGPTLLYKEPDMAVRVIREEFNRNYRGVVIDDPTLYEEVRSYVEGITPELADRVEFFDRATEPLPLFEKQHIHEQLHKAIDRKVWLPSGGSLIIERTEALTVIDVNTGKNVGSSSLEETVFRNNLEAADEIARQLRLRDIGGIIVIDFIDMETRSNRDAVIHAFRDALARDKTRTQVFDISELGLVEMTRKRISEGLVESLSTLCPECGGRGFVFDQALLSE
jgi:ribonuclease E